MNKVILMGRLTRDIDLKYSSKDSSLAVARYSIAVQRNTKNQKGEYDSDFINCVAFGKAAEFAFKYFKKGQRVLVEGNIQTGTYTDKNGNKVYSFNVVAEKQEFADGKSGAESKSNDMLSGFEKTESTDDELPFN